MSGWVKITGRERGWKMPALRKADVRRASCSRPMAAAKRKRVSRSTIFRMAEDENLKAVNVREKKHIHLGELERAFAPSAD